MRGIRISSCWLDPKYAILNLAPVMWPLALEENRIILSPVPYGASWNVSLALGQLVPFYKTITHTKDFSESSPLLSSWLFHGCETEWLIYCSNTDGVWNSWFLNEGPTCSFCTQHHKFCTQLCCHKPTGALWCKLTTEHGLGYNTSQGNSISSLMWLQPHSGVYSCLVGAGCISMSIPFLSYVLLSTR